MLKKTIRLFVARNHFWRHAGFNELSELYASMVIRSLAISMFGIFVPIYLYKLGYDLRQIFLFFVIFFSFRVIADIASGYIVARVGPKHGMALSTLAQIIFLTLLLSLVELKWPLAVIAAAGAFSFSLFFVSFNVEFSKIKHSLHGGKELGYIYIFERVGGALGPLAGGLIATIFDVRYTIALAIILLAGSLVPIFLSAEPTKTRQHLDFKSLPYKKHIRELLVMSVSHVDKTASNIAWPLLLAITVFTTATYAKLGLLISLAMVLTLLFTRFIGARIDSHRGKKIFKYGVAGNFILHLLRPVMLNVPGATALSISNDPVTTAYQMPLFKGYFDASDSLPGYRIAYLVSGEVVGSIAKLGFWLILWVAAGFIEGVIVLTWLFIPVAGLSLLLLKQRFIALKA